MFLSYWTQDAANVVAHTVLKYAQGCRCQNEASCIVITLNRQSLIEDAVYTSG